MRKAILALLLLPYIFASCIKDDIEKPSDDSSIIVEGNTVPSFTVSNGMGGTFSSTQFNGKRSLLVFFHTTCEHCQKELPKVEAAKQLLKNDPDIQVIAIARKEDLADIQQFWADQNLTIPFYLDPDRAVFDQFAKSTIPRLYAINPQGKVTWMAIEVVPETAEEIAEIIRKQ